MIADESYPVPNTLQFPVQSYAVTSRKFGERVRSRFILWARHLGDDVELTPGTAISAIGDGKVVWAEVRSGNKEHRNWGGIVVVGHQHKDTDESFFSLYGHLTELAVQAGDIVKMSQLIGKVAPGYTPENGWWKTPHLHFGIYAGPWLDQILPGYARMFDGRTKFSWWRSPGPFITEYNKSIASTEGSQQASINGTRS